MVVPGELFADVIERALMDSSGKETIWLKSRYRHERTVVDVRCIVKQRSETLLFYIGDRQRFPPIISFGRAVVPKASPPEGQQCKDIQPLVNLALGYQRRLNAGQRSTGADTFEGVWAHQLVCTAVLLLCKTDVWLYRGNFRPSISMP